MIDWARIEGFDWNEGNSRKKVDKPSVSQSEAEQIFFNNRCWSSKIRDIAGAKRGFMRWAARRPSGFCMSPSPCVVATR